VQPEVPPLPGSNVPPGNYPAYTPPPPPPRGGMPVWGWILAGCLGGGFLIMVFLAAILVPVFSQARSAARRSSCLSNQKQIALGNMMYVQDYDERFPMAASWQDGVDPYIKRDTVFKCPEAHYVTEPSSPVVSSYAFNNELDMMKLARLAEPRDTVLTYDSTNFIRNSNDAITSLPTPGRHITGNNISFADGHAQTWHDSEPLPKGQILPDTTP
jgi:prepilin-type processing-associated H-X9-DG protein